MPKVSVVIPAFNAAATILESVKSVQEQTFRDWELIIVDDGSTDETSQLLQPLQEPKIKILTQKNCGPPVARNRAIEEACGEYIAFIDADDLWKPDKLARQVTLMDQDNTIGLLHTDLEMFDEDPVLETVTYYDRSPHTNETYHRILSGGFIGVLTVMVRREVLDDVGLFDPEFLFGTEDWDLWIRILRKHKSLHLPESTAYYRSSPSGQFKNPETKAKGEWKVIQKHLLRQEIPVEVQKQGLMLYLKRNPRKLEMIRVYLTSEDVRATVQKLGLWLWYREMSLVAIRQRALYRALKHYVQAISLRSFDWYSYIWPFLYLVQKVSTKSRREKHYVDCRMFGVDGIKYFD